MGREIKRVPLDFDYPIGKMIWKGYFNPYRSLQCGVCGGSGGTVERECRTCGGDGSLWTNEKIKKLHENWRPEEPPSGDGYQLWETTTEGSPKSPVFESPEELAEWLVDHNVSFFGKCGLDYYEWLRFIRENAEQD